VRSLARFCFSHRRLVLVGWIAALAGLTLISQSVGSSYKDTFSLNGTQSFEAQALLEKVASKASGDAEQVVIATAVGRMTDPAIRRRVDAMSAGAGFGVITAVFQWGWGASLLGIDKNGPIEAFLPVMMFAILFGLSMDYQVFLVSRIYEEWHHSGDNGLAVTRGLAATGRTITAAAAIMVLVFAAFILGGERVIELFGLGLAAGVLIDALVIRSVLVPCLMLMLGRANWALPNALDRLLPHLNVEGSTTDDDEVAPDPPRPHPPGPLHTPIPSTG
jgi:uncharacterized membrane protein YdfJ with MMPL/SSD domain